MNGWRRLWVVTVGFSGLVTVALILSEFQTESSLDRNYQYQVSQLREVRAKLIKNGKPDIPINMYSDTRTLEEVDAEILGEIAQYKIDRDRLPHKQFQTVAGPIALWIIGNVSLYLLGVIGVWVFRGFRPKKV